MVVMLQASQKLLENKKISRNVIEPLPSASGFKRISDPNQLQFHSKQNTFHAYRLAIYADLL